ncbi:MAG: hypothetical protein KDD56_10760 [Bdellovibrionales bacterium]|nr:hypothetical protein [Bdellovibrionales bacterium]
MKIKGKDSGFIHDALEQLKQKKSDKSQAEKLNQQNEAGNAAMMEIDRGVAQLLEDDNAEATKRAEKVKKLAAIYRETGTIEFDTTKVAEKLLEDLSELGLMGSVFADNGDK